MNQHYAFWVSYYDGLTEDKSSDNEEKFKNPNLGNKNSKLTSASWEPSEKLLPLTECEEYQAFNLEVQYPGLALGLGLPHNGGSAAEKDDSGEDKNGSELQLGCSLDYTTGLPLIPGSNIKGALRSAFLWNKELTKDLLRERLKLGAEAEITDADLKALEIAIFGGRHPYDELPPNNEYQHKMGTDIFLDAYPIRPDRNGHLLGIDYITPHLADDPAYQGLTGPNINAFLKVLPGVVYRFRFLLSDTVFLGKPLSADSKKMLFRSLLMNLGVGAKTRTGYGYMEILTPNVNKADSDKLLMLEGDKLRSQVVRQVKTAKNISDIHKGDLLEAKVVKTLPCEVELCAGVVVSLQTMKMMSRGTLVTVKVDDVKGRIIRISEVAAD